MMDVRKFEIEKNWFEITQDRLQWSTICEHIYSSVGVGEGCAATGPQSFLCTFGHSYI